MKRSDDTTHRDVGWLLTIAVAALVARIPLGLVAVVGAAVVVLCVRGIRPTRLASGLLWPLLISAWLAALMATALISPSNITNQGGSFAVMSMVIAVALAVMMTGRPHQTADHLARGVWWGLRVLWAIAVGEIVTGVKLLPIMYPDASAVQLVQNNRLYASATFPNYNDFCVALVLLVGFELAAVLARHRTVNQRVVSGVIVAVALGLIAAMGSRGALMGSIAVILVVGLLWARRARPHLVNRGVVSLIVGGGAIGLLLLIGRGVFSDNSSKVRVGIIDTLTTVWAHEPLKALFGYGSLTTYKDAMSAAFPDQLLDPHNLLLELGIWFGVPVAIVAVGFWVVLVWRGLVVNRPTDGVLPNATLALATVYPVIGVVPSSTLRYHVFWFIMIAAATYVATAWRRADGNHGGDDHGDDASDHPNQARDQQPLHA